MTQIDQETGLSRPRLAADSLICSRHVHSAGKPCFELPATGRNTPRRGNRLPQQVCESGSALCKTRAANAWDANIMVWECSRSVQHRRAERLRTDILSNRHGRTKIENSASWRNLGAACEEGHAAITVRVQSCFRAAPQALQAAPSQPS